MASIRVYERKWMKYVIEWLSHWNQLLFKLILNRHRHNRHATLTLSSLQCCTNTVAVAYCTDYLDILLIKFFSDHGVSCPTYLCHGREDQSSGTTSGHHDASGDSEVSLKVVPCDGHRGGVRQRCADAVGDGERDEHDAKIGGPWRHQQRKRTDGGTQHGWHVTAVVVDDHAGERGQ